MATDSDLVQQSGVGVIEANCVMEVQDDHDKAPWENTFGEPKTEVRRRRKVYADVVVRERTQRPAFPGKNANAS